MSPSTVYMVLEFVSSLLFSLIFTVSMLYQVTVVQLSPLQLVLVGTTLEASVFLFEVPTGVLADVKSRRLSIIIGYVLIGLGFIVEGSLAFFATVVFAQVLWGLGYTFTSGATQAWIADEIGAERAGEAFLRGSQAARIGALVAVPLSVALGTVNIRLPIITGGVLMILLAAFLAVAMTEEGFAPTPPEKRTTWAMMLKTLYAARDLVHRQPVLLLLLAIGLFFGLYSEGFDRLWTAHLLENFELPFAADVKPVVWFGVIQGVSLLISIATTEVTQRRVDTRHPVSIAHALILFAAMICIAMAGFGLTRTFWTAVVLLWLVDVARSVTGPLQTAWFNLQIDDRQVRATMFSVTSQVDAIGQITGGPVVGSIGNVSIRAALVASAFLLLPVIPLYGFASKYGERRARQMT